MNNNFFYIIFFFFFFTTYFTKLYAQNNALDFDGSNDYVLIGDVDDLDNVGTITFEAWINFDITSGSQRPISKIAGSGGLGWGLATIANTNMKFFVSNNGSPENNIQASNIINSVAGAWHHFAVVYNGGEASNLDRVRFYLDGVEIPNGQKTANNTMPTTTPTTSIGLALGARHGGTLNQMNAQMDEVRIWNIARSATEIQENMNCKFQSPTSGLIAVYNLDEGTGSTANDGSGNGNNGTLNGSPTWITSTQATASCQTPGDVPSLSEWGLIILALLLMTLGTLVLMQPNWRGHFEQ